MDIKEKSVNHQNRSRGVIIIIIIALVAAPISLFRSITNNIVDIITQTISLQYSQELNAQMSSHISSTIDYYFHEINTQYNALSLIKDLDEDSLRTYIADTQKNNSTSYVAFVDNDGYVYEDDGSYLGTMRVTMIGELLNGAERIITDNVTIGNENYVLFGASFKNPVQMGNKSICIGLLGMDNDELAEHIVLKSDYSGGFSSIINKDGSYVVKNSADTKSGLNVFSILEKNYQITDGEIDELKRAVNDGETGFINARIEGTEDSDYMYFAPVSGTEWYIVNTLPSSFIKTNIIDLRDTLEKVYIAFILFLIVIAAIIVFQQMYSRKKLRVSQDNLAEALRIAEEASNAKTSFLFSMSHDIRTPMNAILGYTDIGLSHADDTELARDSFEKIKMSGGHLLNLINDILEMSRIESGKMVFNEKPLDIRESISDITVMSRALAAAKSIDYETVIGDIRNPYIYADELHVNEVIINIISNAVKYTPEGGKVRYLAEQTEEIIEGRAGFRFEISDNGYGMSEEFQKHLFETFSREENSTISRTEGTGLGLSIVKRIVDMTGGEIRVQSAQNVGSTFTVEMSFRTMDEQAIKEFEERKREATEIPQEISLEGKKVLLAEDNELNREIATYILEGAGLKVETAEDGKFAVNAVIDKGTEYYDLILMDIQMPVMNGYEATGRIRELPGGDRIPIIALSANAFEEDKKKSIAMGMDAHVAKPIDIKILIETMRGLIK